MARVGLYDKIKTGIWTKYATTRNKLETIMVNLQKEKCAYNNF